MYRSINSEVQFMHVQSYWCTLPISNLLSPQSVALTVLAGTLISRRAHTLSSYSCTLITLCAPAGQANVCLHAAVTKRRRPAGAL